MTIDVIFEIALAKHWSQPRFVASGWAKEVRKYYKKNIGPSLGPLSAVSLTPRQVREWHRGLESTPTSANRSLEVLSRIFTFAQEEELIPWGHPNPCQFVRANTERQRTRIPTDLELRRIGALLLKKSETHPRQAAYIVLLALTGARPRALANLKLGVTCDKTGAMVLEFDGKSTHKTGLKETIVVPPFALEILSKVPREEGLLIGKVRYRELWEEIRKEAGCPDLWARDFRRLFATTGLSSGLTLGAVGELLSQKSAQTTMRYAKLLPTARIEAVDMISSKLAKIMELRS